jgi:ParB/RepB/Spo0J family partition protein
MNTSSADALAGSMKSGFDERPAGRLRGLVGQESPVAFAVPLRQDAYEIAIDHVEPDPKQPRKTFDDAELQNLAASIRENGFLQPIVVYRAEEPGRYRIIAGERRYRAAILAGKTTVPCLEMPPDFDRDLVDQLQLVENFQRADLYPIEAAEAIEGYMTRHRLSQREAAERLGKPLSFVAELLAIRKIPEDLLAREGVAQFPKQVLVEIGRAPADEQARLVERALSGSSLAEIKDRRSNRERGTRLVYFRERFLLEAHPPIEIRWKKHPDEVSDDQLIDALSEVARVIASRRAPRGFELRTPR